MKSVLIRLSLAISIGLFWQIIVGWEWGDFIGRSIIIALVTVLSYPLERWLEHRNSTPAA